MTKSLKSLDMNKSFLTFFLALLCFGMSSAAQAQDKIFNAQKIILDNGLEVIAIPNPRAPVVTHMIWYEAGAADEQVAVSGVAHYMEHLMFKGSKNVPPGEFSKRVRALGGEDNAFTAQDYTAYFQTIASEYLGNVMQMESDRMAALDTPADEAVSELKVVLEERRQRLENNPSALLMRDLRSALYPNHPYNKPIIGWKADVEALTLDKALGFYKTHYAPNNARLIVSGDISMDTLEGLAKKYYGGIEKRDVPERHIIQPVTKLVSDKSLILKHPQVRQPTYIRLYRAPAWTNSREDSLALVVLQEILAGGADAPLYQKLVVEDQIASSITMDYDAQAMGPSYISFSAYPAKGKTLEDVKDAVLKFLSEYQAHAWKQADIEAATTKIQDRMVFLRDSVEGPAMILGQALAGGMTLEEIEVYPKLLETVTPDDLSRVTKEWLSNDIRAVDGYLRPEDSAEAEGEKPDA